MSSDATGAKPPAAIDRMSGELRKADLQDAATQLFSERGYDGSSLQEIADRIGILKGSVYYYYQSKEDLLFDIVKAIHDEHLENVRMLAARPGDPMQRLHAVLVGHAIFVCDNLVKTTVFLRELERLPAERQAEILRPDHSYQRVFRDLIVEAQDAGLVAAGVSPKLASLWILGSLNWLHRWYCPSVSSGPEQVAEQFADQLTRGIKPSALWEFHGPSHE
ncbi:MAG: TetR family transcriptional regulator [Chelatococcus sp.]|uniref:TetR/AcrR family transcriptional regulator n=1 Tax=Chelatococcus sp. TaxID=1953771 RepID=UPI0025BAF4D5|nr:TetR/AcrR family transcriptional regulator [Chelatococcus sp.]MBX3538920.1 TetR family transcriptional regulator [Chelatococcus sp.]